MKKQMLLILTLLVLTAVGAAACTSAAKGDNLSGGKEIAVDGSQSGQQIEVAKGDVIKVTLDSNVTTGFQWSLVSNSDESVVSLIDHEYIAPPTTQGEPVVGAGGSEEWRFSASTQGTSRLQMEYSRPWEETIPPAQTFDLTIVVK